MLKIPHVDTLKSLLKPPFFSPHFLATDGYGGYGMGQQNHPKFQGMVITMISCLIRT
jgi:hypothetical protein